MLWLQDAATAFSLIMASVKVPHTSSKMSDGLYYKKLNEKEETAKARVTARKEEQKMLVVGGAQFSFYEKDMQRIQEKKKRIEAHRNNRSMFQVCATP